MCGVAAPIEIKAPWCLASLTFDVSKFHAVSSQGHRSAMLINKHSSNDMAPNGARLFADGRELLQC